ncbi:MAG TPA: hypothetical protein VGP53_05050 [Acidimicrobiales bacterium]|nr:hypothetical protein [Acidimicrobiales bacterium]
MDRLRRVQGALQHDVELLTGWVQERRASVRSALVDALAAIDRSPADPPPAATELAAPPEPVRPVEPQQLAPAVGSAAPEPVDPTPSP